MSKRFLLGALAAIAVLATAVSALAIIGGGDAPKKRYPWLVQIRLDDHLCTGSLVAPEWVVTMAHCVTDESTLQPVPGSRLAARVGSDTLDMGGEVRSIVRVIPYPDYDDSGGSLASDLALARLSRGVSPTPVPLVGARRAARLGAGSQAFIAGWGATESMSLFKTDLDPARELKDALVRMESNSFCRAEATEKPFDPATQLCSTASSGEACHGDSGGPLFLDLGYPRSELLGVIAAGDRHCKPGHPNLYVRLTGGPMREWLRGQLAATSRPLAACPDVSVRGDLATVTVRHIRANVDCATARTTATDVVGRDDCVEETPDGVNECDANGFACATRLENGPAGVAFDSACEDGMRRIRFRQGSAAFARGPRYRLRFGTDGRPTAIGPFDIAAGDRTIGDMIAAFGRPDTISGDETACTVRWDALGLKAYAVDYGTSHACDPGKGLINAAVIVSPRFATDRGLVVGMSEDELLTRHPRATTRSLGPGDTGAFDNESASGRGDLYSIHQVESPIGFGGAYASLKALVVKHTVAGLEVAPILGGD